MGGERGGQGGGVGGSGADPAVFAAFGKDPEHRRESNSAGVAALSAAFAGEPVGGGGLRLQPPAFGLAGRLWQAAFSREGARYVGAAGSRLLLNRATFGSEGRTDEVQAPWAEAYRAAYPVPLTRRGSACPGGSTRRRAASGRPGRRSRRQCSPWRSG